MSKYLLFTFTILSFLKVSGQNSFNFSCSRDTTLNCASSCIILHARIPNISGLSNNYTVNPISGAPNGCYRPAIDPAAPGSPTNLTVDDVYSQAININFTFPFYGSTYTQLLASTNGYLSFDISKAGAFSHYAMLNSGGILGASSGVGQDLPTSLYDKGLIMGPYHDLYPVSSANPPAGMQIKYDTLGVPPYRKFVLSFNTVPLYYTGCNSLNQNTSQIVLYESLGIAEVFIASNQICSGWNQGRSLVGMQDFTRTNGIMAPGRAASSTPWGTVGMNESWRFTPIGGATLFKKVQLFNLSGTLVSTGDTVNIGNGVFDVAFPNVCSPANATTTYIVKSTYSKFDDPTVDIFGTDTIRVITQNQLSATAVATPSSSCGAANGTITVTVTAGSGVAPFQYSLNGGASQSSNVFSGLAANTYTVLITDAGGCQNTLTVVVGSTGGLNGNAVSVPTGCPGVNNGSITVTPLSGTPPYQYSLNGGPYQASNVFTGLAPGIYNVVFKDVNGCTGPASATVGAGAALTGSSITIAAACPGVSNGSIRVIPGSGTAPFTFSLNGGAFQPGDTFTGLAPGTYSATFKDANGCTGTLNNIIVGVGSGLSANTSFINPPCAGIPTGSITVTPNNGTAPYSYSLNGGAYQPSGTFNGLAAGVYTISFQDAIGCRGTATVTLVDNSPINGSATPVAALCNGVANGSASAIANGGIAPYQYSIDGGITYQLSNVFNGLMAGTYTIRVKDANGCTKDIPVTVTEPSLLVATSGNIAATCNGNDGTISLNANGGTPAYLYSIDNGVTYLATPLFITGPGTYNTKVKDANGCIASSSVTVTYIDTMRMTLGPDTSVCVGGGVTLIPQTNPGTNIFKWTPSTGLNNDSIANPVASPNDTTSYILVAKWGICQRTDTIRVNVMHKPVAHAGNDTAICYKTFALLHGTATNLSGPVSYAWTPANTVIPSNSANGTARPDSTQLYTLTVKDNYGCNFTVTDDILVTMQPPVPAYAGADTNAVVGVPHQLFGSGGVGYLWSPAGPLNNPTTQNPLATLTQDTYFTLQVTDVAGCIGYDYVFIKAYQGPTYYVPNAFTPNGDGLNDIFRPTPVGMVSTEYFRVFNRYGQMVFETSKWLQGWDGTFMGKKQVPGTYIWNIRGTDKNGKIVEKKGTILLIR